MSQKLSVLPVGAKVKDVATKYNGATITWLVGGHNHYGANQTTLVSEKAISLKLTDAKEPLNADDANGNRRAIGNNRYSQSNIRQWLNSNSANWYSAQHSVDTPPSNSNVYNNWNEYEDESGFLTNFSDNLRNALSTTTLKTVKSSFDGGGSENVSDKVFLLSRTEVGLGNENDIEEGALIPLFSSSSKRIVNPTAQAVSKSEYKNSSDLTASKAWYWWLRTPYATNSYVARYVYKDGTLSTNNSFIMPFGVRPAINIASTIAVSDAPDADGAYTIVWNATPVVNLTTTDAQTLYENTSYSIAGNATDADNGNIINVKYSINDGTARALATGISDGATAISFAKTLTFKDGKLFDGSTAITDSLAEGTAHMLRVWATDDQGATSTIISRSFYAVPNRAPSLTVDTPQPSGSINSDKFAITGTCSDIDGNEVTVAYRINGANPVQVYKGQGGAWSFDVSLATLQVGANNIVVEVTDSYNFKATKTVRLNKNEIKTPVNTATARYKLTPPKGSATGVLLWVRRTETLQLDAKISMVLKGEQEQYFAPTDEVTTAQVSQGIVEDEFIFETAEAKTNIVLKLEMTKTQENDAITLITGVFN